MKERKVEASMGKGDDRKDFTAIKKFADTLEDMVELSNGSVDLAVDTFNESLNRKYQAQMRGAGKSTKTEELYNLIVQNAMIKGLDEESAKSLASQTTGYVPNPLVGGPEVDPEAEGSE